MAKKTDHQVLDEALAQQEQGTYVDPVAGAKRFLARTSHHDLANKTRTPLKSETPDYTYGDAARETGSAMAVPLAFAGGPVGMGAGAVMALEGLNAAIKDPSATNALFAALGTLPFVKPVKAMVKGAKEVQAIKQMKNTYGAGDMGAAYAREVPYRAAGGPGMKTSAIDDMLMGMDRAADVEPGTRWAARPRPVAPKGAAAPDFGGPETLMQRARGQVEGFLRGQQKPAAPAAAPVMPASMAGLDKAALSEGEEAGISMLDELLSRTRGEAPMPGNGQIPMPRGNARPAPDYVHPADTSGGMFGFDDLPELGESELSRLQELFKRLGL